MSKLFKSRFELYAIPARNFWDEYKKTKFKYCDEDGIWGFRGYVYICYIHNDGSRCVLIGTKERIWSMRQRKILADIFRKGNIDLNEVLEDGKVVIAREVENVQEL